MKRAGLAAGTEKTTNQFVDRSKDHFETTFGRRQDATYPSRAGFTGTGWIGSTGGANFDPFSVGWAQLDCRGESVSVEDHNASWTGARVVDV